MKLINASRRPRGIPLDEFVTLPAGGEVDINEYQLSQLQKRPMVRNWMQAGVLLVQQGDAAPEKGPVKEVRRGPDLPEGITGTGIEHEDLGGGWTHLWVNGFKCTDKAVRKKQAEKMALDYRENA